MALRLLKKTITSGSVALSTAGKLGWGKLYAQFMKVEKSFFPLTISHLIYGYYPLLRLFVKTLRLPYDYYKTLDWIEHIANIRVYSQGNTITATFGMHDKKVSPFSIIMDFIGQEIIDRKNSTLYQAIAQK